MSQNRVLISVCSIGMYTILFIPLAIKLSLLAALSELRLACRMYPSGFFRRENYGATTKRIAQRERDSCKCLAVNSLYSYWRAGIYNLDFGRIILEMNLKLKWKMLFSVFMFSIKISFDK